MPIQATWPSRRTSTLGAGRDLGSWTSAALAQECEHAGRAIGGIRGMPGPRGADVSDVLELQRM